MPEIKMQRFRAVMPPATHRRTATCEEVDCPHYLGGWETNIPTDGQLANDIRIYRFGHRQYTEQQIGSMSRFVFPAGQVCFRAHSFPTGRAPIYKRERPGQAPFIHARGEDWMEDFGTELEKVERMREAISG